MRIFWVPVFTRMTSMGSFVIPAEAGIQGVICVLNFNPLKFELHSNFEFWHLTLKTRIITIGDML
jgi:hypothetical protein